jgi:hypothetical protein
VIPIDEMVKPEDILEEVDFEIAPDAFSTSPRCIECDVETQAIIATKRFWDGKIVLAYEIYECPSCGRRFFNGEQARRYEKVVLLLKALAEDTPVYEQEVRRFEDKWVISLPLDIEAEGLQASVKPLTRGDFLIRLHS